VYYDKITNASLFSVFDGNSNITTEEIYRINYTGSIYQLGTNTGLMDSDVIEARSSYMVGFCKG